MSAVVRYRVVKSTTCEHQAFRLKGGPPHDGHVCRECGEVNQVETWQGTPSELVRRLGVVARNPRA